MQSHLLSISTKQTCSLIHFAELLASLPFRRGGRSQQNDDGKQNTKHVAGRIRLSVSLAGALRYKERIGLQ